MHFRCIHASYSIASEIPMSLTQVPVFNTVIRTVKIHATSRACDVG